MTGVTSGGKTSQTFHSTLILYIVGGRFRDTGARNWTIKGMSNPLQTRINFLPTLANLIEHRPLKYAVWSSQQDVTDVRC